MHTVCAYNFRDHRWSPFSRCIFVKMAVEGSSLFCDDDKSCEKHPNESDEDDEKYISAPIGMTAIVLSTDVVFLVDFRRAICVDVVPPAFVRCCTF